jgi:hypothetical protein
MHVLRKALMEERHLGRRPGPILVFASFMMCSQRVPCICLLHVVLTMRSLYWLALEHTHYPQIRAMLVDKYPKDLAEVINDLQNYVNPKVGGWRHTQTVCLAPTLTMVLAFAQRQTTRMLRSVRDSPLTALPQISQTILSGCSGREYNWAQTDLSGAASPQYLTHVPMRGSW